MQERRSYKEWAKEPWHSAYQITGNRRKAIELVHLMQQVKGIDRNIEINDKETKPIYEFRRGA